VPGPADAGVAAARRAALTAVNAARHVDPVRRAALTAMIAVNAARHLDSDPDAALTAASAVTSPQCRR
jgi:hypothetical protein